MTSSCARQGGVFVGMGVLGVFLMILAMRQMVGITVGVATLDSGAPIEVTHRAEPLQVQRPRRGLNRTVTFGADNPYGRANQANRTFKAVAAPWDLREMKDAKQTAKKLTKLGGAVPPSVTPRESFAKPQKVFESSKTGKGFQPGDAVLPTAGEKLKSMSAFVKVAGSKCVSLVGFYNSDDVETTREFAGVWNELADQESTKFGFALVDVHSAAGLEIAINASVVPTDLEATAVGLPAILAYTAKGGYAVTKTVLKGTGKPETKAGKKEVLAANTGVAMATKKLIKIAENLKFGLAKEGCFLKFHTEQLLDVAIATSKSNKNATVTSAAPKTKKDATAVPVAPKKKEKKKEDFVSSSHVKVGEAVSSKVSTTESAKDKKKDKKKDATDAAL